MLNNLESVIYKDLIILHEHIKVANLIINFKHICVELGYFSE